MIVPMKEVPVFHYTAEYEHWLVRRFPYERMRE